MNLSESKCLQGKITNVERKVYKDDSSTISAETIIEAINNVPLPGSAVRHQPPGYYPAAHRYNEHDPLNTIGVPIYNNALAHNYYTSHLPPASNYYIPGLSEPSSPSNCPTVPMSHPGHPSHAIIFSNDPRPSQNRPTPTHVLLTSNPKRTKHLKPPSNNKLKSKPVTIHHITPVVYPVQSSSQSALFHPPSSYALPSHSHPHPNQHQPISIIPVAQYPQRDQLNQRDPKYAATPTAPRLYEEEPSPLPSSGLPPSYATIDPKKLRTRHIRPAVFKRKGVAHNGNYQLL